MENRIWSKNFVLNCVVCFIANLSYYMTMVVITDYSIKMLGASLSEAGFVCVVFILGALFARLFIGRSIEKIGMKKSLFIGMSVFIVGILLNLAFQSVILVSIARFLQGISFRVSSGYIFTTET